MHNILLTLLLYTLLISCRENGNGSKNSVAVESKNDTLVSFSIIKKDSVHIVNYHLERKIMNGKLFAFHYTSKEDEFILVCDTSRNSYSGIYEKNDTAIFDLEQTKYYTINGNDFKVLKLIGDKNVTDAAFSVFLSIDFGLLLSKSNTWSSAKVLCVDKGNSRSDQLSALLYRMQTDEDFFPNPIPNINKFTPPKFE
ncbi:hypothetical protein [Flavihumibacter sp. ZG627]|uniref:hypothetical protein n=1 Tax=Flavihumibacter sp. ZG627 TaxID=1463156 RepID=UPI00057EE0B9|nr:hypothetical protein [Flavihumibacter sp. ZG627]KIC89106.1 hypothetical protein HY58_18690 [Flavihumibacter sp. ZG627]